MIDTDTRRFIERLEACTLPTLDHEGHVRTAWFLSVQHPLSRVLELLPPLLRRYAASKGHPEIYHETVTFAFACLIHERVALGRRRSWTEFKADHPDLLDSALLERYYDADVLTSADARRSFVFPAASDR